MCRQHDAYIVQAIYDIVVLVAYVIDFAVGF
jgi:hypothetical protein